MQIFISTPSGNSKPITFSPEAQVSSLKDTITSFTQIPANLQNLCFGTKILADEKKLNDYNITNFSSINLTVKCLGGVLTETDRAVLTSRQNKKVCRVCYATNSVRATNCRKKEKCGRSTKLRMKKNKKSTKKSG